MERAMARDKIHTNDRQLACARINSPEGQVPPRPPRSFRTGRQPTRCCPGQDYLKAMSAAANYAWVNRSSMTFLARQTFAKIFERQASVTGLLQQTERSDFAGRGVQYAGRSRHARCLRRVAQHRQNGGTHGETQHHTPDSRRQLRRGVMHCVWVTSRRERRRSCGLAQLAE